MVKKSAAIAAVVTTGLLIGLLGWRVVSSNRDGQVARADLAAEEAQSLRLKGEVARLRDEFLVASPG